MIKLRGLRTLPNAKIEDDALDAKEVAKAAEGNVMTLQETQGIATLLAPSGLIRIANGQIESRVRMPLPF